MPIQITLNFDCVHARENKPENEALLNQHRDTFDKQCWQVLVGMMEGNRYTTKTALLAGIGDLRRRVKDLIDTYKIPIAKAFEKDEHGNDTRYKVYYLEEADRKDLALRFLKELQVKKAS